MADTCRLLRLMGLSPRSEFLGFRLSISDTFMMRTEFDSVRLLGFWVRLPQVIYE